MPSSFTLTSEEAILWDSIKHPFVLDNGESNTTMTNAFVNAAKQGYPNANAEADYARQIPQLFVFLKKHPQYLEELLPVVYRSSKAGCKTNVVRALLNDIHRQAPDVLASVLPAMFKTEKSLGLQIPLLMDMAQYVGLHVFETLDFKLLLKASPEKVLKALTPTPATWDPLMALAKGLLRNEATQELAHSIAGRVGLQVATSQPKDQKTPGVQLYDWALASSFWKSHDWAWELDSMLSLFQMQAKGESIVSDMVASFAIRKTFEHEKANAALDWVHANVPADTPLYPIDSAVMTMYRNAPDQGTREKCLAWFNNRAEKFNGWQFLWQALPPEDAVKATQKMVDDYLMPEGITKAMLLSRTGPAERYKHQLGSCGVRLYTLLNHSQLPLGNMDEAMCSILQDWCTMARGSNTSSSSDALKHNVQAMMDTLGHGMQEPMRQALRASNGFKQLVLYTAYLQDHRKDDWDRYTFTFMPKVMERPLSLLADVYPEHRQAWETLQLQILDGSFKRENTVQIIAKVLFDQNLNMSDIENTSKVLDCTPETFFCSLQAPSEALCIPSSFDFNEVSPS